jgi:hypothetical protein
VHDREREDRADWADWARVVALVEGDSDAAALDTLAGRLGRDLRAEGVHVISAKGVTNFARLLREITGALPHVRIVGLYDEAEERHVRRALQRVGAAGVAARDDIEANGFFVCVADLEDELIRALGVDGVERVLDAEGELASFRRFQQMPHQRDRATDQQLRRFLGTRSMRKVRYGRLLVRAVDLDDVPTPLTRLLERAAPERPESCERVT